MPYRIAPGPVGGLLSAILGGSHLAPRFGTMRAYTPCNEGSHVDRSFKNGSVLPSPPVARQTVLIRGGRSW